MNIIIFSILGLLLGGGICYLILQPKLKERVEYNQEVELANAKLQADNEKLISDFDALSNAATYLKDENQKLERHNFELETRKNELSTSIQMVEEQAQQSADIIYKKTMEVMQENLAAAAEVAGDSYRQAEEEGRSEYLSEMEECAAVFENMIRDRQIKITNLEEELNKLASKVRAATAARIRDEEINNKRTFYSINLSSADIAEIKRIREVIYYLRNGRPVNKAIWESYYRNPTNELVNRVVGKGTRCGIYRICSLLDDKVYIGQSTSIGERFKSHIKCGLGIDAPSNKLYTAMQELGVENFSFEVIEECQPSELNEREKYWIDYYQSNIYGYNMSVGGAKANQ